MSVEEQTTSRRGRWWWTLILVASAAEVLFVAPGIAGAGGGDAKAKASEEDQMVAEAIRAEHEAARLYNERKWDEFGLMYTEDAIVVPPNHEPVHGRAAITEFYKGRHDAVDALECGQPLRATATGKSVSLVGRCSVYEGRIRVTTHELYQQQPDGSLKLTVDMYGFRDPRL